jgi:hypothetical protein
MRCTTRMTTMMMTTGEGGAEGGVDVEWGGRGLFSGPLQK